MKLHGLVRNHVFATRPGWRAVSPHLLYLLPAGSECDGWVGDGRTGHGETLRRSFEKDAPTSERLLPPPDRHESAMGPPPSMTKSLGDWLEVL